MFSESSSARVDSVATSAIQTFWSVTVHVNSQFFLSSALSIADRTVEDFSFPVVFRLVAIENKLIE